jgi:ribonuclease HI
VANRDLWEDLDELAVYHDITWTHLPGHPGDPDQDRCDKLAAAAARRARRQATTDKCTDGQIVRAGYQ